MKKMGRVDSLKWFENQGTVGELLNVGGFNHKPSDKEESKWAMPYFTEEEI